MPIKYTWRVRCTTEAAHVTEERWTDAGKPTVCPNDAGHSIVQSYTSIIAVDRDAPDARDPTVTDDDDLDYTEDDKWTNSETGAGFILEDPTIGAAVWKKTSEGSYTPNFAERTSILQTTSTDWTQALRLTTDDLEAGIYRVGWMAVGRNSNIQGDWRVQVQVDDTINIIDPDNGGYVGREAKDAGDNQRTPWSGFRYVTLASGVHTIDLDVSQDGNGTAYLYHAVLEIWRAS
jgi:hypothetical protein